jgi:hypothetical protein
MSMLNDPAALIGLRVEAMFVTEGEHALALVTDRPADDSILLLDTEGDCCSESWWADATGVMQLLHAKIVSTEDIELDTPEDGRSRQDEDQAYGLRINTDHGSCDLIFRNSSNGYYGGTCLPQWVSSLPDGVTPITRDWRA